RAPQSQAPNRIMDILETRKRNIEGYSNDYTDQYYRYENKPTTCSQCSGNQYPYLTCGNSNKELCSATNRPRNKGSRTRRSTGDWLWYELFIEEKTVSKTGRKKDQIRKKTSPITDMDSSMQNFFLLDGEPDIKRW
ncbi:Hypothetical predicted protein, partial [Mytilus galloprovincialis]